MKTTIFALLAAAFLLILLSCAPSRPENVLEIDDFEREKSLGRWSGPVSLSKGNVSHGSRSLRIDLSDRRDRILEITDLPSDWSPFYVLAFSFYNPSENIQSGQIQILTRWQPTKRWNGRDNPTAGERFSWSRAGTITSSKSNQ